MRKVRYSVAVSLDGFIADPHGGFDWIIMDPEIDFEEMFQQFDTLLMGRSTYETMTGAGPGLPPDMRVFVFSRTLLPQAHPKVTVVAENPAQTVAALKDEPGKDIWLFGGGALFRSLIEVKQVDEVEAAIMPVLLGEGIPLLAPPIDLVKLRLEKQRVYKTGIVMLTYAIA